MTHILFSYNFKDPDHNENIGEPDFEDIFHYNFFSTDTNLSPKETDVEEIDILSDVRDCDLYFIIELFIYIYLVHITCSRSTTNGNVSVEEKFGERQNNDNKS